MTQHGSFPGRPRGRRARPGNSAPDWQGYDATPADQREFPDLTPIRPREARERDAYPPGPQDQGGYGGGEPGGQYPEGAYPGGAYPDARPGQPPRPGQQAAEPWPPSAAERPPGAEDDEVIPSWAEPDSVEAFSARWHRRGLDSRDERRAGRRKRRRLLIAAGTAAALVVGAVAYLLSGGPGAANLGFGGFVTTFLPGELQSVPDPCAAVPGATISQYLPGKVKQSAPPLNSGASTECAWTLDDAPTYRVLQVGLMAYSPSGLASGNGSATFAAEDAFQESENSYAKPGPKSGQPPAKITDLSGMPGGNDTSAFQATQVFDRGGATMDVANVLVRYRNVIITVVVDGLAQSSGTKYGPVSMSELAVIAGAVGREMAGQIAK